MDPVALSFGGQPITDAGLNTAAASSLAGDAAVHPTMKTDSAAAGTQSAPTLYGISTAADGERALAYTHNAPETTETSASPTPTILQSLSNAGTNEAKRTVANTENYGSGVVDGWNHSLQDAKSPEQISELTRTAGKAEQMISRQKQLLQTNPNVDAQTKAELSERLGNVLDQIESFETSAQNKTHKLDGDAKALRYM